MRVNYHLFFLVYMSKLSILFLYGLMFIRIKEPTLVIKLHRHSRPKPKGVQAIIFVLVF